MTKVVTLVAVAALGVAAWQAVEAASLRTEVQRQQAAVEALTLRMDRVQSQVEPQEAPPLRVLAPTSAEVAGHPAGAGGDDATPVLEARLATPEGLAREVRDMRRRMEAQEETIATLRERVESGEAQQVHVPRFIGSVEDAARELKLDDRQRAEVERAVADVRADIERLRAIPNDDGKTWADVSSQQVSLGDGDHGFALMLPNMTERKRFLDSRVPGRSETYGQAEERIRGEGRRRVEDVLTPEQRETWDDAHTAPLFGGSGGDFFISAVSVETPTPEGD
jgi:hypothetical protein